MTWPLQEKFAPGGPITQIPLEWFETVSAILNNIGGVNCLIEKTAAPSEANPWQVIVNLPSLELETIPPHDASTDGFALVSNGTDSPTWQELASVLPAQSGHDGKFLTTNGTAASWEAIKQLGNGSAEGQLLVWNNTAGEWQLRGVGAEGTVLSIVSGVPAWAEIPDQLPAQTGNSGKFLTTDGSVASWADGPSDIYDVLEGVGTGFVRWNDTANTFSTYLRMTASLIDSNITTITDTFIGPVMLYAPAGANQVFVAKEMAYCIGTQLGSGGTKSDGQVLTLNSSAGSWLATWEDASGSIPSGTGGDMIIHNGSAWAVLSKPTGTKILQNASGTFSWIDAPTSMPTGGSTSMVLQKASATNYDIEWDWVRTV